MSTFGPGVCLNLEETQPKGLNMHRKYQHPEALPDEVFWVNVRVKTYFGGRLMVSTDFAGELWKTKRLGGIAYDCKGKPLIGFRPVFIKKEEALTKISSLDEVDPITASYYR